MSRHISLWRRELPKVVRQRRIPAQFAGSHQCRGSAACIIATILQPELLLWPSLIEVEDEMRERCARRPCAAGSAVFSCRLMVAEPPFLGRRIGFGTTSKSNNEASDAPGLNLGEGQPGFSGQMWGTRLLSRAVSSCLNTSDHCCPGKNGLSYRKALIM